MNKILNKKIPENKKYTHIKPAINTGQTVRRKIDELREKQRSSYHRRDEVFNRIKFSNFIELIVEAGKVYLSLQNEKANNSEDEARSSKEVKKQKGLTNVIMGIGEIDLETPRRAPTSVLQKDLPYLLLDVRDKDKYLQCHFKTAKHYPSALLTRSIGYETEDLKLYRNCSLEIIILYDDDESIATRVATTLVQRGYDNIFLLSGGLKYCSEFFPRKPLSSLLTSSVLDQNRCPSPSVQIKNSSVEYFTQEDIDVIEQYLDFPRTDYATLGGTESCVLSKIGNEPSGRIDSARSSATSIQGKLKTSKSALDNKTKVKKAPWK